MYIIKYIRLMMYLMKGTKMYLVLIKFIIIMFTRTFNKNGNNFYSSARVMTSTLSYSINHVFFLLFLPFTRCVGSHSLRVLKSTLQLPFPPRIISPVHLPSLNCYIFMRMFAIIIILVIIIEDFVTLFPGHFISLFLHIMTPIDQRQRPSSRVPRKHDRSAHAICQHGCACIFHPKVK